MLAAIIAFILSLLLGVPAVQPYQDRTGWKATAIAAGWEPSQWPHLDCIIWRESRGIPTVHNVGPVDDSYGLTQLNMLAHRTWVGPLVGYKFDRLYDPLTNLRLAHSLYLKVGWKPWGRKCG